MKKLLPVVAIFLAFSNTNLSYGQCCTFTLTMLDSYGDGWTGNSNIDIIVNGVTVLSNQAIPTCACTANTSATATFNVCPGDVLSWNYDVGTSSYLFEESFQITDAEGNVIDSDGPTITPGTTVVGAQTCPETCSDGIQNQDETGVDCGGTSCWPCHCTNGVLDGDETAVDYGGSCGDCFDGIQNGSETGVDCGGVNCMPCTTNSTTYGGTACCSNTATATVYPTNCDQVGTSVYNNNSPVVNINASSGGCIPSPAATGCGAVSTAGEWVHLELDDDITYLQMAALGGTGANGNHSGYAALYQGNDCGSLSYVSCQQILFFSSGSLGLIQAGWENLDPNQDVWIYVWDDSKSFNLDFQFIGVNDADIPSNTACPGSDAIGEACNLGTLGDESWPSMPGACNGGNWGSNENTTYYSFTATDVAASLLIENIICNDGTNGNAQFGVWTDCASIGTYGSEFLGCAVGTGSISLSGLTPGQTYYIAADGFAGDNCTWGFTGAGILLPVEMASFGAVHFGTSVELDWSTFSETNNDYFTVQRTADGVKWTDIGTVKGAGTTTNRMSYEFTDYQPYNGVSYYRIKQTDFNGEFEYSEIKAVKWGSTDGKYLRTVNLLGQEVDSSYKGIVVDQYSDGSSIKRLQD